MMAVIGALIFTNPTPKRRWEALPWNWVSEACTPRLDMSRQAPDNALLIVLRHTNIVESRTHNC